MAKKGLNKLEYSTDYDWAGGTGTWNEIDLDDVLHEDFDLGQSPDVFESEMASLRIEKDGLRYRGSFKAKRGASNLPTDGATGWLKATPHSGNAEVMGGTNGATFQVYDLPLRLLDEGQAVVMVSFTMVGQASGDVIKDG